jgi:hypothetical protein
MDTKEDINERLYELYAVLKWDFSRTRFTWIERLIINQERSRLIGRLEGEERTKLQMNDALYDKIDDILKQNNL